MSILKAGSIRKFRGFYMRNVAAAREFQTRMTAWFRNNFLWYVQRAQRYSIAIARNKEDARQTKFERS